VNRQIAALQAHVKQHGTGSSSSRTHEQKQADEHESNVVMLLQSKLANVSMSFKDVLELRTQASHRHFFFSVEPPSDDIPLRI
jgi:syntaxin 5